MAPEDPFEPKLGKIRAQAPKPLKSFRSKVLHATARSGGMKGAGKGSGKGCLSASKRGRGAGVGRVLSASPGSRSRRRRVVLKARYVKLAGKGLQAAAHLKYIQRDGVTREGEKGQLYGPTADGMDAREFLERSAADRNQFRFIVAPEDGAQYDDLKPLTRKLMTQMEEDLGTKLDWVAVDHYNTGHPHTHIVIRGVDDQGKDLVIAREYISQGFRERAEALVSLDLGPRSDLEISNRLKDEVAKESLTSIDRHLLRDAGKGGLVAAGHKDPEASALRTGRLTKLRDLGLAEDLGQGHWQLRPDMEGTLRRMGERGDIIKTMHRELKQRQMEHAVPDAVIHDIGGSDSRLEKPITGRVLARGLIDEMTDRQYLMVEATDGRVHYLDIGQGDRLEPVGRNTIVHVTSNVPDLKPADHTIIAVAKRSGGYYDVDTHLKQDVSARQAYAETHVRRLEAIRRTTGGVELGVDGRFKIGPDYPEKAIAYERQEARRMPVTVNVLTEVTLDNQARRNGVTFLDQTLVAGDAEGYADQGFGQAVKSAMRQRQQWLLQEGLASENAQGQFQVADKLIATLHHRELQAVCADLARETGLSFTPVRNGDAVEGKFRQIVTLGTGKFAMVERARDFSLVPWRPVLDKHIGKEVSGIMREAGISWSIGRSRGPSIE